MQRRNIKIGVILLCSCFVLLSCYYGYQYLRIKNAKIEVTLQENREIEFYDTKRVSDFIKNINGKIVNDYVINSKKLGKQDIVFDFINHDGIKLSYTYDVIVKDTVSPIVWLSNSYLVERGSHVDLAKKIMCGDNYDSKPSCTIEGIYDLNQIGTYPLIYKAVDNSGNTTNHPFDLIVYEKEKTDGSKNTIEPVYTEFASVIANYKKENTKIGIDVSGWQGDIDFVKLKQAGVEFIMIRIGGNAGDGKYFLDKKFIQNIKYANQYGIDAGVYFYSYADSLEQAKKDAKWVLKQIKDYDINLPIAFDWEEWGSFNEYNLSFFGLTSMAEAFLNVVEEAGYEGMLYSSKSYLEEIWLPTKYDKWLAHYTNKTNYKGNYKMWQLCDNGKIDGIDGAVDIDIMYIK